MPVLSGGIITNCLECHSCPTIVINCVRLLTSMVKFNRIVSALCVGQGKVEVIMPPALIDWGHILLSVVRFNLLYNFLTLRDRDLIFGMHTPVMMAFQMKQM